jgi:hypothetical protein
MTDFNTDTAISILSIDSGDDEFVINFEDVWVWVGYSTKSNAMVMLRKRFHEGVDYELMQPQHTRQDGGYSQPKLTVMITKDCFKALCCLSNSN